MPPSGQHTVGAGTFWGVLNVLLCASGTQLGLDLTYFVIRHLSLAGRFQLTGSDDFSLLTGDPNLEVFQIFIHLGTLTHP